jgi:hypothetical protein
MPMDFSAAVDHTHFPVRTDNAVFKIKWMVTKQRIGH